MHRPRASTASRSGRLHGPEGKEPGRFILQPSGCAGDGLRGTRAGRWAMRCCFSIKHLQNQQMSSAVMSVSPPPLARHEMKVFPSEPQPPAWPQLPQEDASHKLGLSLCWGVSKEKRHSPWKGRGSSTAPCWDAYAALELTGHILPCTSVVGAAGTGQVVTKPQPANHLDQPAALPGVLQLIPHPNSCLNFVFCGWGFLILLFLEAAVISLLA